MGVRKRSETGLGKGTRNWLHSDLRYCPPAYNLSWQGRSQPTLVLQIREYKHRYDPRLNQSDVTAETADGCTAFWGHLPGQPLTGEGGLGNVLCGFSMFILLERTFSFQQMSAAELEFHEHPVNCVQTSSLEREQDSAFVLSETHQDLSVMLCLTCWQ